MPSPFGHMLAGAAIGLAATPSPATSDIPRPLARHAWSLPALCAVVAALPDADLLLGMHRTATHSVTATAAVFIVTAAVTGKVTGRPGFRLAAMLAAAHASHLLLDWLGSDHSLPSGLQLFWPFDPAFYISQLDWFPPTERRLFTNPRALAINVRAFFTELAFLGPVMLAAWAFTRTRKSRVPTSAPDTRRRPFA